MLSMSMAFTSPPYLLVNSPSGTSRTYSLRDLSMGNQACKGWLLHSLENGNSSIAACWTWAYHRRAQPTCLGSFMSWTVKSCIIDLHSASAIASSAAARSCTAAVTTLLYILLYMMSWTSFAVNW